ncbi:MAG: nucleoside phosphorylase [Acidobacteria bacterium]|nr:nucleoside phosphorylase [Acidobacteriota bacterium]
MNEAIVIIAAARGELRPLTRSWAALKWDNGVEGWQHPSRSIFALYGGMGADAATRAFARAKQICIPTFLFSVGWAGALDEDLAAGDVLEATDILDTRTGEQYGLGPQLNPASNNTALLLTTQRVAAREEKLQLKARYPQAAFVDMEAGTLARLALANNLPFRAIKAISDTLHEDLPDLNPFISPMGQFCTARFALHAAMRPQLWPVLSDFGKNASLAAKNLCETLARELSAM